MGPLYKYGWFDFAYSLQLAGLIGFCFGFLLERAGFGNPRKLTAIFYLRDFAVLKVMFTAIVVCLLGLLYFSVFGWIDLAKVYILPTYIWPQIVGGLVLGIGFVMGGYCPTTSVVATVSGRLDGLIFIIGMVLGSFIFGEVFPLLEKFYSSGQMGVVTLSQVLGLQSGLVALLVCLMAIFAYWLVEKVEQRFGDPETLPTGSRKVKLAATAVLVALGLILAVVNPDSVISMRKATAEQAIRQPQPSAHPAPVKPQEESGFTIVEDEGC
ncbi:MAG: YeeE/YedE family protein [Deltaproteobacteria bacterium]|nr:YeeE/YedE family protein [Deltaproteobacteria bacterium]MBW1927770.1 YeeE/YedE family protein [Deltaproteobacteria bacterium]MBW2024079.1 YeeE/YedE family protein [Deltaproteobacteria bacterium]MBW2124871.1 YeeE/YedE family protein [Deltaproteobacteria bacterium]RLB24481.1 MAG: sulfurtransferase [Deltaproteobacteria bacterium]